MSKKRVLIVAQEMKPYLISSDMARITNQLPVYLQNQDYEVRVLMPRFGVINERRHRLHEVVRLSGINVIINDDDFPLIIKVASLPGARLQVYFLDNEDFFKRKTVFEDEKKTFYPDNAERMVFFCKGVVEVIKKFGWPPDIIHCNGWMTSLIPMYVRTAYKREPVFHHSKVVYSLYDSGFAGSISKDFVKEAWISKDIPEKEMALFKKGDIASLNAGGMTFADGIISGSAKMDKEMHKFTKSMKKPSLEHVNDENTWTQQYEAFYKSLLKNK
jgi:starch synthase